MVGLLLTVRSSMQETSTLSDLLKDRGIKADYYHAGQGAAERKIVQNSWQTGEISVVCATIAYGMGIDKPNVRLVLCCVVLDFPIFGRLCNS